MVKVGSGPHVDRAPVCSRGNRVVRSTGHTDTEDQACCIVEDGAPEPPPLTSFMGKGKGCFANAAEIDAFIRSERDSWGR